jgi:hypothetical protein
MPAPFPPAFRYILTFGLQGEFEWDDQGSGKAVYIEDGKWVQRGLTHQGTKDYYHFAEPKVEGKKRRVWAFAVDPSKPTAPIKPPYAVGFYYEGDMKGTWKNDMWAARCRPDPTPPPADGLGDQ